METVYKKSSWIVILWLIICLMTSASSIKISHLIENGKEFDGKMVYIEAEVIGDIMVRGEKTWINVNDGTGAMGIYIDTADSKLIKYKGKYETVGDKLGIKGNFHHAFEKQSGDMAIEAQSIEILEQGHEFKVPIEGYKWVLLGSLLPIALVLYGIQIYKRRY